MSSQLLPKPLQPLLEDLSIIKAVRDPRALLAASGWRFRRLICRLLSTSSNPDPDTTVNRFIQQLEQSTGLGSVLDEERPCKPFLPLDTHEYLALQGRDQHVLSVLRRIQRHRFVLLRARKSIGTTSFLQAGVCWGLLRARIELPEGILNDGPQKRRRHWVAPHILRARTIALLDEEIQYAREKAQNYPIVWIADTAGEAWVRHIVAALHSDSKAHAILTVDADNKMLSEHLCEFLKLPKESIWELPPLAASSLPRQIGTLDDMRLAAARRKGQPHEVEDSTPVRARKRMMAAMAIEPREESLRPAAAQAAAYLIEDSTTDELSSLTPRLALKRYLEKILSSVPHLTTQARRILELLHEQQRTTPDKGSYNLDELGLEVFERQRKIRLGGSDQTPPVGESLPPPNLQEEDFKEAVYLLLYHGIIVARDNGKQVAVSLAAQEAVSDIIHRPASDDVKAEAVKIVLALFEHWRAASSLHMEEHQEILDPSDKCMEVLSDISHDHIVAGLDLGDISTFLSFWQTRKKNYQKRRAERLARIDRLANRLVERAREIHGAVIGTVDNDESAYKYESAERSWRQAMESLNIACATLGGPLAAGMRNEEARLKKLWAGVQAMMRRADEDRELATRALSIASSALISREEALRLATMSTVTAETALSERDRARQAISPTIVLKKEEASDHWKEGMGDTIVLPRPPKVPALKTPKDEPPSASAPTTRQETAEPPEPAAETHPTSAGLPIAQLESSASPPVWPSNRQSGAPAPIESTIPIKTPVTHTRTTSVTPQNREPRSRNRWVATLTAIMVLSAVVWLGWSTGIFNDLSTQGQVAPSSVLSSPTAETTYVASAQPTSTDWRSAVFPPTSAAPAPIPPMKLNGKPPVRREPLKTYLTRSCIPGGKNTMVLPKEIARVRRVLEEEVCMRAAQDETVEVIIVGGSDSIPAAESHLAPEHAENQQSNNDLAQERGAKLWQRLGQTKPHDDATAEYRCREKNVVVTLHHSFYRLLSYRESQKNGLHYRAASVCRLTNPIGADNPKLRYSAGKECFDQYLQSSELCP